MTASVVPFPAVNKSRKAHARFRDDWLSRLAGNPAFSAGDLATGLTLVRHMNAKTRQAWPSIDRIALLTGRSPSTVWRSIGRLKKAGLITVIRGRGRYAPNRYCFVEGPSKTATAAYFGAVQRLHGCDFKDCAGAVRTSYRTSE